MVYFALIICILSFIHSLSFQMSPQYISPKSLDLSIHLLPDEKKALQLVDNAIEPKFRIKSLDEIQLSKSERVQAQPVMLKQNATFGSLTVKELKERMVKLENSEGKPLPQQIEDLNGINPITPITFSVVPFLMAYLGYQVSSYLAAHFAVQFLTSDIYTFQRLAIVSRNILVGSLTLITAFSAIVGVGLLLLGLTVAVGVLKGQLDPNKKVL
jgi:hypothetical protein